MRARSAPGAFSPKPATRAHPGPHKLSVARDVQREEPGEARSGPESARASRVMKWLRQDLLLASPGAEGKPGCAWRCCQLQPEARARSRAHFVPPGPCEVPRVPGAGLALHPDLRFQAGQPGMDCLPFLQRCRISQNFAGQLDGIENFSFGRRGFAERTFAAAAVSPARSAREEMLTRPESCAALLTSKLQRKSLACGTRGWPSSQLPGEKETCLPLDSLLTPQPPQFLGGPCESGGRGVRALLA